MMSGPEGASLSDAIKRIRMAMHQGDLAKAGRLAQEARKAHPEDAGIANTAGDLALKSADFAAASDHFEAASKLDPETLEYAVNYAIALQRLDRHTDAVKALAPYKQRGLAVLRYCSVLGTSHRALGEMSLAAHWYDAVLALDPQHQRGLHGRARVAIERGEADAVQRFDAALAVNPGDGDLWLGKAQALEVAGDIKGARLVAEQLCDQAPSFLAALSFLSGLRLAAGDADFTAPFVAAALKSPQDPNIPATHAEVLAGLDFTAEAAEIAQAARKRFPDITHFTMLEAVHSDTSGDWDRADALFKHIPAETPMRALHEARHRIRGGQIAEANNLLDEALVKDPWDVSTWALRGIAWRLARDERAQWLHEQEGLIQFRPLIARLGLIDDVAEELRALHSGSTMPLGQSLRGGTQTRGILFHRTESLFAELHDAITSSLEEYRADLPPTDAAHPLLRHRNTGWSLAGSWSVRLTGGGDYHSAHVHYQGLISSALYIAVPDEVDGPDQRGWLEIGRPKPDLGCDLPPIVSIKPQIGHLALFPSTSYHGTSPFTSAERLSVAFDVVPQSSHT